MGEGVIIGNPGRLKSSLLSLRIRDRPIIIGSSSRKGENKKGLRDKEKDQGWGPPNTPKQHPPTQTPSGRDWPVFNRTSRGGGGG